MTFQEAAVVMQFAIYSVECAWFVRNFVKLHDVRHRLMVGKCLKLVTNTILQKQIKPYFIFSFLKFVPY